MCYFGVQNSKDILFYRAFKVLKNSIRENGGKVIGSYEIINSPEAGVAIVDPAGQAYPESHALHAAHPAFE